MRGYAASEFAGTKNLSWSENLTWYERAHEQGLDEVVLLNERGEVCECTSANIFAAVSRHKAQVWTPPLASGCLPGVTRALLLEEIRVPGLQVGEKTLLPADLEAADEIFITSTTRELLPVVSVEGLKVGSQRGENGKVREQLQKAFTAYVENLYCVAETCRYNRLGLNFNMQLACPNCGTRDVRVSHPQGLAEYLKSFFGVSAAPLPALQQPLGNQRLGERILEVCALSPLLPAGIDQVDETVL